MIKTQPKMTITVKRIQGTRQDGTKYSFQRFTTLSKSGKKFDVKFRKEVLPQGLEDDISYDLSDVIYNVDQTTVYRRVWVTSYKDVTPHASEIIEEEL